MEKMFKFHEDTVSVVKKEYDLARPGRMDEAVKLLSDWVNKQEHFTKKDFSKEYLERMIIASKGLLERAKGRLDKMCTYKTLMPHLFGDHNAKEYFKYLNGKIVHVIMPILTPNHERIIIAKYTGNKYNSNMILDGYRFCIMVAEYMRAFDYAVSYQIIIDFRDASVANFVTSVNIMDLRQAALVVIEGYGVRVKGIHLITESKLLNTLIGIGKQVLSEKIVGRIKSHKNLESLHKVIPKNVLPKELGGPGQSINDINDNWMDVLSSEEFRSYWREMTKACTDESKRQSIKFNDQYMGMPGSFRKLNVD